MKIGFNFKHSLESTILLLKRLHVKKTNLENKNDKSNINSYTYIGSLSISSLRYETAIHRSSIFENAEPVSLTCKRIAARTMYGGNNPESNTFLTRSEFIALSTFSRSDSTDFN